METKRKRIKRRGGKSVIDVGTGIEARTAMKIVGDTDTDGQIHDQEAQSGGETTQRALRGDTESEDNEIILQNVLTDGGTIRVSITVAVDAIATMKTQDGRTREMVITTADKIAPVEMTGAGATMTLTLGAPHLDHPTAKNKEITITIEIARAIGSGTRDGPITAAVATTGTMADGRSQKATPKGEIRIRRPSALVNWLPCSLRRRTWMTIGLQDWRRWKSESALLARPMTAAESEGAIAVSRMGFTRRRAASWILQGGSAVAEGDIRRTTINRVVLPLFLVATMEYGEGIADGSY